MKNHCISFLSGVSSLALMLVAQPTLAQTTGQSADAAKPADTEIVVTGSYFAAAPKPRGTLEVVSAKDIQNSVKPSITAILADLPATQGNLLNGGSNDNNNSPAQTINLRGLGTRATLVLLNGQRQTAVSEPTATSDGFAVDLNSLVPTVLIGRVEVLKDGASALYGSDAVAGVVNFITRKDLKGLVVQADGGLTTAGGRKNGKIGLAGGIQGDDTSIIAGMEYAHQDQIYTRDIFNNPARIAKFGQSSGFGNPGTYFYGGTGHPDAACGSVPGSYVSGTTCRYDLTVDRGMVAQMDRGVAYASIDHHFSDTLHMTAEFGGAYESMRRTNSIGFLASNTSLLPGGALTVPASNPGNPYGVDVTMNYRTGSLATPAITATDSTTLRARLKLDYNISSDWKASLGGAYSTNSTNVSNGGYYDAQRFQAALNCKGGPSGNLCFNPFGTGLTAQPGSPLYNSPDVINWFTSPQISDSRYALSTFDALITGKLFQIGDNKPVRIALGAQNRHEKASDSHDELTRIGGDLFGGPAPDYSLGRTVNSLFGELQIPLLPRFEIDAAVRMEASSPGGTSTNPKVSFTWNALDGLTFSGGIGRSQRAPGLLQYVGQSGLGGVTGDKYVPAAQNGFAVVYTPSTGLRPETATNINLGVNLSKDVGGGHLSVNLDAWNINFKSLITAFDFVSFILANPDSPAIVRNPSNNYIVSVTVPGYANANQLLVRGFDFDASYAHSLGFATLTTRVGGTLMNKYRFTNAAGTTSNYLGMYNTAIAPIARLVMTGSIGLSNPQNALMLTANYKSPLHETTQAYIGITEEKSYTTLDLTYHHNFTKTTSLNLGVVNLFATLPPAQGNSIYTANSLAYPLTGRTVNAGFRVEF